MKHDDPYGTDDWAARLRASRCDVDLIAGAEEVVCRGRALLGDIAPVNGKKFRTAAALCQPRPNYPHFAFGTNRWEIMDSGDGIKHRFIAGDPNTESALRITVSENDGVGVMVGKLDDISGRSGGRFTWSRANRACGREEEKGRN